jgi:hypothetical protein
MTIEIEAGASQLQKNLRQVYGGCSRCPNIWAKLRKTSTTSKSP